MFKLTRNLKIFAAIAAVLTLAFHYTLSRFLAAELWNGVLLLALGYGVSMYVNGFFNGRKEVAFLSRADFSFSYHLVAFIVVIPLWMPFLWTRPETELSNRLAEFFGAVCWGVALLIHYFASRRSIKGYDRKEVFD
ncbi:hypothetical protein BMS3Bbin04_01088 [bacterium BMS3Bbin04]|nr:hypothetical protein BMS3Bbin04_01088 [bacterium BMS3Bbin04]